MSHLQEDVALGVPVLLAGVVLIDKLPELPVDLPNDVLQFVHPVSTDYRDPVHDDDRLDTVSLLGLLPHDFRHQLLICDIIHEVIRVIEVGFLAVVKVLIVGVVIRFHVLLASHVLLEQIAL